MAERHLFSSRIGFILAAAASAVGLGNLWRFPYLSAKFGGGIFLLTYIILVVTLGFTIMITEVALGRKTGKSALWAYGALKKKWHWLGILALVIPCIIVPYYSVIGGWIMEYGAQFITGQMGVIAADAGGFFGTFISANAEPIIWTAIFMVITGVILLFGVQKGIQRVCTIILPILIVLLIGLAIYCLTLPGGLDGLAYYIIPDFTKFTGETVLAAMGQMFYSLSLAMGIMITYGSYVSKKENIETAVRRIEIFDTGVAILAGLLIVPAVFVFSGGSPEALGAGPGLMFIQLPQVFATMPLGSVIGSVFFVCVFFAALTSAISLAEVPIAAITDKFKISRKKAVGLVLLGNLILGVIINLGYGVWADFNILGFQILDFMDALSNNFLMPVLALVTCIFVGWILKPKAVDDEVEESSKFKAKKFYHVMVKFIAPVCVVAILIYMVVSLF